MELIEILEKIKNDKENRNYYIDLFQNIVWNSKLNFEYIDLLKDLAYDLDYYESNDEYREEDMSYYDENRLITEINKVLSMIRVSITSLNGDEKNDSIDE